MVGSLSTERNNCEPFQVNRVPRVRAANIKASASFSSLLVFVHIIDTFFTVFFFYLWHDSHSTSLFLSAISFTDGSLAICFVLLSETYSFISFAPLELNQLSCDALQSHPRDDTRTHTQNYRYCYIPLNWVFDPSTGCKSIWTRIRICS